MQKSRTILVTGSAGFIGFHVSKRLLEEGFRVIGIDSITTYYDTKIKQARNAILLKHKNYTFYKNSIADYAVLEKIIKKEKPEIIIHLAAQAGVRYSLTNPWAYVDSNYLGTLNIFESAKRQGIKRILFASSSSVYGDSAEPESRESDRTDHPVSFYGASKKANEVLAYAYHSLYGIEAVGLRFFTVYGTFGRPDLALFKFVKAIISQRPIDVYNKGKMKRNFTHVDDVVNAIMLLVMKKKVGYNIYNIGGAESVTLLDFIKIIESSLSTKAKIVLLPMQLGDVKSTNANTEKARREIGFDPKVSLKQGIKEFTDWFVQNKSWLMKLKDSK